MQYRIKQNPKHGLFEYMGSASDWSNAIIKRVVVVLRDPDGDLVCMDKELFKDKFEGVEVMADLPPGFVNHN
jgi:hypothetical protein